MNDVTSARRVTEVVVKRRVEEVDRRRHDKVAQNYPNTYYPRPKRRGC